jgi:predicted PolB exonuclease-like 3'-5' exonuclease
MIEKNNNGYLVFDIETIPNQNRLAPEFDPESVKVGNLKDAAKIADKIAEAKTEWESGLSKKLSLDGDLCEIVFREGRTLVSWNGKWFDVPILWKRGVWNRVIPYSAIQLQKVCSPYDNTLHIDCKRVFYGDRIDHQSNLKSCCNFLGIECKTGLDGSMIYQAYKDGRHGEITAYNLEDCHATYEIAKRIGVIPEPVL